MKDFNSVINCIADNMGTRNYSIYEKSFVEHKGSKILFARFDKMTVLLVKGSGVLYQELQGKEISDCKVCPLTHENRLVLNQHLFYTNPIAFGRDVATIGLGDRLGIATPAHICAIQDRAVKPVLAQQSKRELNLTGRTYQQVLDDVCYGVLIEGYQGGFGADGDHLKDEKDIAEALSLGFSMITLDCSEKIDKRAENCGLDELNGVYDKLPVDLRNYYERTYLFEKQGIEKLSIVFNTSELKRNVLIYHNAICFIEHIFDNHIKNNRIVIDLEISLDETDNPTSYLGHFFVANELKRKQIEICSLAPRFVGEFQKGIDYIGDITLFGENLKIHAAIAQNFGYKLSIHSGSDKFSTFSIIGEHTNKKLHIKTSGTSWLEAIRAVIYSNPVLYRKIHKFALRHFEEARKFYHVSADLTLIKDIDQIENTELMSYMEDNNARQLIHITYGIILNAEKSGMSLFKDRIYQTLLKNEDVYKNFLIKHIEKHLDLLGFLKL